MSEHDASSRRIGCIFAHPDDETFCVGGIVAKYASRGTRVDLYCATNGDAGKSASIPVSSREELAELRQQELRTAASLLGIDSIDLAHHDDGALEQLDPKRLTGEMVAFIRRTRPDVILTFGPEGAPTRHKDHIAVSRAATAAFFLSGLRTAYPEQQIAPHQALRLFYHAWEYPLPNPRFDVESVPFTAAIDVRDWKDLKAAAFKAHVTQQGSSEAFYSSALKDVEHLALAAGAAQPRPVIDDLFEGLER